MYTLLFSDVTSPPDEEGESDLPQVAINIRIPMSMIGRRFISRDFGIHCKINKFFPISQNSHLILLNHSVLVFVNEKIVVNVNKNERLNRYINDSTHPLVGRL